MTELDDLVRRLGNGDPELNSLVAAVELHRLSAQMRGLTLSDHECIHAVLAVREAIVSSQDQGTRPISVAQATTSATDYTAYPGLLVDRGTAPLAPGQQLAGTYRLRSRLGIGGMAEVFLAEHLASGAAVAIKVMHAASSFDRLGEFFEQEAKAMLRLDHPSIIRLQRMGVYCDRVFLVTEYVEGRPLRELIRPRLGMLGGASAIWPLYLELVAALAYTHQAGIIHRDLKPDNIMVLAETAAGGPRIKVMDFGLAIVDSLCPRGEITGAGEAAGTLAYMAPEQSQGRQLTPAADVYGLAVIGYEMISGINPFRGVSPADSLRRQQEGFAPPLAEAAGPITREDWPELEALDGVFRQALAREPEQRPRDAQALLAKLAQLADFQP